MKASVAHWCAPPLSAFEEMAHAARDALPSPFKEAAQAVVIRVEDLADAEMLADLGIEDPFELTGLYDGVPLTEKSFTEQSTRPDVIWLFRRAILDEWADRETEPLGHLVAHVFVHELAHHFGWSDDDIAAVDAWWQ